MGSGLAEGEYYLYFTGKPKQQNVFTKSLLGWFIISVTIPNNHKLNFVNDQY
jgi:hypothetical protein